MALAYAHFTSVKWKTVGDLRCGIKKRRYLIVLIMGYDFYDPVNIFFKLESLWNKLTLAMYSKNDFVFF